MAVIVLNMAYLSRSLLPLDTRFGRCSASMKEARRDALTMLQLMAKPGNLDALSTTVEKRGVKPPVLLGGISPQEAAGLQLTQRYYESAGWEVFGREVQVRLPNGNKIYPDFLFGNKTTGELILVDAKETTGKRYYQEPGQRADWKLLEKEGGTITGGFRHPGQGGGFASPEVQRKLTGMRLAPGTRVGV
jgi:hypothetical protein